MYTVNFIEQMFNTSKCKYELMDKHFTTDKKYKKSFILINVNEIIHPITSLFLKDSPESFDPLLVASNILNIVGHYRHYFNKKKISNDSYVFLYYSDDIIPVPPNDSGIEFDPLQYKPIENLYLIDKELKNSINYGLGLVKQICAFIPGVYFVHTGNLNPAVFPYYILMNILQKHKQQDFNALLVSSNPVDYQAIPLVQNIHVYKRANQHGLMTQSEIIPEIFFKGYIDSNTNCGFSYYKHLLVLLGCDRYKIPALVSGKKNKYNLIKSIIDHPLFDVDDVVNMILQKYNIDRELYDMCYNYVSMDASFIKNKGTLDNAKSHWAVDLVDYELESINEQYFRKYKVFTDWLVPIK